MCKAFQYLRVFSVLSVCVYVCVCACVCVCVRASVCFTIWEMCTDSYLFWSLTTVLLSSLCQSLDKCTVWASAQEGFLNLRITGLPCTFDSKSLNILPLFRNLSTTIKYCTVTFGHIIRVYIIINCKNSIIHKLKLGLVLIWYLDSVLYGDNASGSKTHRLAVRVAGSIPPMACRSVLVQDTWPPIAPDMLVGTLHGSQSPLVC